MKIGRRVLRTGIVAGGLLWMPAVATQDLHAQCLPIGSVTGSTTGSENTATFQISAGFPALEEPADPDVSPSTAREG